MDLNLKNKKVFIFDWDGTIFNSMDIKIENFTEALSALINPEMNDYKFRSIIKFQYKRYSGLARKTLYKNILRELNIRNELIKYSNFTKNFSRLNKTNLLKAEVFNDAISFLNLLIKNKRDIFISSSIPQGELRFFTSRKLSEYLKQNIKGIIGSRNNFSKGSRHFEFIENNTGYKRDKFLFIGDDLYDYMLSRDSGVDFILINRTLKKFPISNIFEINSFNEMEGLIDGKV